MKNKAIFVYILILILLVFAFMFSMYIDTMQPKLEAKQTQYAIQTMDADVGKLMLLLTEMAKSTPIP